jgi:hypothetical protein
MYGCPSGLWVKLDRDESEQMRGGAYWGKMFLTDAFNGIESRDMTAAGKGYIRYLEPGFTPFDPVELAKRTEEIVCDGKRRKYTKFCSQRFYGGIATGYTCGCCLRCIFCWVNWCRDFPEKYGFFVSPEEAFGRLESAAVKAGVDQLRLSGAEPTLGRYHLLKLLKLVEKAEKEGTGNWSQMIGKLHDQPVWQACWRQVMEYGLKFAGRPLPVVLENCPSTVQINVRGQKFGGDVRRVLHLFSRDEKPTISGAKARVLIPPGCKVEKVFDPIQETQIPYAEEGGYVSFAVPPFDIYRSVVVGMRQQLP